MVPDLILYSIFRKIFILVIRMLNIPAFYKPEKNFWFFGL